MINQLEVMGKSKFETYTYTLKRNHHALVIEARRMDATAPPTAEDVAAAVLEEYPWTPANTMPSQAQINNAFKSWYRWNQIFDFTMPFPWKNNNN